MEGAIGVNCAAHGAEEFAAFVTDEVERNAVILDDERRVDSKVCNVARTVPRPANTLVAAAIALAIRPMSEASEFAGRG
jgi:hypothetical protein